MVVAEAGGVEAIDDVVAGAAHQQIGAAIAVDDVVAGAAEDGVGIRTS